MTFSQYVAWHPTQQDIILWRGTSFKMTDNRTTQEEALQPGTFQLFPNRKKQTNKKPKQEKHPVTINKQPVVTPSVYGQAAGLMVRSRSEKSAITKVLQYLRSRVRQNTQKHVGKQSSLLPTFIYLHLLFLNRISIICFAQVLVFK